jgi:hypothetical protein
MTCCQWRARSHYLSHLDLPDYQHPVFVSYCLGKVLLPDSVQVGHVVEGKRSDTARLGWYSLRTLVAVRRILPFAFCIDRIHIATYDALYAEACPFRQ